MFVEFLSNVHSLVSKWDLDAELDFSISLCLWRQVGFVQYSDDAKTEFRLNTYSDKGTALGAIHLIGYKGGNTKTGAVCLPVIFRYTITHYLPLHLLLNLCSEI